MCFLTVSCGKSEKSSPWSGTTGATIVDINDNDREGKNEDHSLKIKNSSSGLPWRNEYTYMLREFLSEPGFESIYKVAINPDDLALIGCSNFNQLNGHYKKIFFIVYLAAIAEAESDFRSELMTINPGDNTLNIGLLQIDYVAANNHSYGHLGNLDSEDLKIPLTNLKAGAYILRNQIAGRTAHSRLFPERTYYWQALTQKRRVLKNIRANGHSLFFCNGL